MPEVGAAITAAQLLSFSKEPLRYRPRLTHGRETFPGGLNVFRFAQGRFPHGVLRELPIQERERLRKAAVFYIRQVCLWDGATHYQVLCVPPDARRETIKEHYHGLMALLHPDRQDADSEHWPPEAAPRVNRAYAVLSDGALRREYDAGLRKASPVPAAIDDSILHRRQPVTIYATAKARILATRDRFRRHLLPVAAVVAAIFFLAIWWAGESVGDHPGAESAASFEQYLRWTRNVFSGNDRPRFMGSGEPQPTAHSAAKDGRVQAEEESLLTRLAKAFSSSPAQSPSVPARPAEIAAVPRSEPRTAEPEPTKRLQFDWRLPVESAVRQPAPPLEVDRRAPAVDAQASARHSAPALTLDSREMEVLVVRVVAFYESGDLERLLAMFDPESLSVWEAMSLRRDFQDFFQATSMRKLHVRQVSWDKEAQSARAKGQATLVVEYRDERKALQRNVALDMDVLTRGGRLRIARLSLFPHE